MDPKIQAILEDDTFWFNVTEKLLQKKKDDEAARAVFVASPTFHSMLAAFTDVNVPVRFDNEELAYFEDRVLQRVWHGQHTKEEAEQFLDALSHPTLDEVPREGRMSDENCPFFNERYRHKGVVVSILSGQGTIVSVSNTAEIERPEGGA